jgi:hypothetical protein
MTMIFLASDIPTEILREKGFIDWVVYLLAFLFVVKVLKDWFVPEERKISGTVDTKPAVQHADKAALDALTKTVNSLSEEISAQFNNAQRAGEARVSAITQDINAEMSSIAQRIGLLAEALHEKINHVALASATHGEAIGNLKAADSRHDAQVARIQQNIEALLDKGKNKH